MYKTRYVALFDWQTLILIFFDDIERDNGGTKCTLTITQDRAQFRPCLLGFLQEAHRAKMAQINQA